MNNVCMCKRLYERLNKAKEIEGKLHSVFNHVININYEDELISILSKDVSMMPMAILLSNSVNFKKQNLSQDMNVVINKNNILVKEAELEINIGNISTWNSLVNFDYKRSAESKLLLKIDCLERFILNEGSLDGIASITFNIHKYVKGLKPSNTEIPLNNYSNFIIERIAEFLDYIMNNQLSKISKSSKRIIGFGPGLTPSIDDFIAGLMISFVYLSDFYDLDRSKFIAINNEIVKEVKNRTTKVSETMILFASRGECSEVLRKFIHCLLSDTEDTQFINCLRGTISLGETSGTDTLSGVYIGCRMMQNKNFRRVFRWQ